tara:strand:- start:389 stop:733 length:345 start_codon:yes stop_codon:yes gene_type:complete
MDNSNSGFFEKVYKVCLKIPKGRVTSYGAIAKYLGSAKSARMVGWALNSSKSRDDVPAHRVVNRNGMLTGKSHFSGSEAMQQLLTSEGIPVKNLKVQDFQRHFWDPMKELPPIA